MIAVSQLKPVVQITKSLANQLYVQMVMLIFNHLPCSALTITFAISPCMMCRYTSYENTLAWIKWFQKPSTQPVLVNNTQLHTNYDCGYRTSGWTPPLRVTYNIRSSTVNKWEFYFTYSLLICIKDLLVVSLTLRIITLHCIKSKWRLKT